MSTQTLDAPPRLNGAKPPLISSVQPHLHNLKVARAFLDLIEPGGEFLFVLKPDPHGMDWPKGCPAHIYGKVDMVWPLVERFNNEAHRVGVFVVVNAHPRIVDEKTRIQRGGRHVTRVRATFIDADSPDQVAQVEAALKCGPQPNAVVTTGRGRHYYWIVDDLPPEGFQLIQRAIAAHFGTDPSVSDRARIMRLPGTCHVKTGLVAVACAIAHDRRIGVADLTAKLGLCLSEVRPNRRIVGATECLPEGCGLPPLYLAGIKGASDEFTGGIVESWIEDAKNAGLALAKAGRLAERDEWRDLILFPFTALAYENPKHEDAIKSAFDAVSAASGVMGANTSNNDSQWDAQMHVVPRKGGRTLASTFAAAGEVNATRFKTGEAPRALTPHDGTLHNLTQESNLLSLSSGAAGNRVGTLPAFGAAGGAIPPSQFSPPGGVGQAFGGTTVPLPKPRPLNLAAPPPHRRWVLGKRLVRGETSILAAPGGRAKSSIAVAWACSLSCGKNLVGEWVYGAPKRVLYISTEDDTQELDRRFHAAMLAHALTPPDLANIEALGVDIVRFTLTTTSNGAPTFDPAGLVALRQHIDAARADVVVLDPLASVVPVGLNDNGLVAGLMAQLKALAVEKDFALLIIHHFKKGADGSAEGVGGASAIVNHARAVFTVEIMGEREAVPFGIMPSERWRVLRVADLKLNLAPPTDARDWLHLDSVTLPNAAPPDYPNGESVQAVTRFKPQPIGAAGAGTLDAAETARIEAEFIRKVRVAQDASRAFYANKQGAKSTGVPAAVAALADIVRGVTGRPPRDCDALAAPILADLTARGIVAEKLVATASRHKRLGFVIGPNAPAES